MNVIVYYVVIAHMKCIVLMTFHFFIYTHLNETQYISNHYTSATFVIGESEVSSISSVDSLLVNSNYYKDNKDYWNTYRHCKTHLHP